MTSGPLTASPTSLSDAELRRVAALPRPWSADGPREPRCLVFAWRDDVVARVNQEHTWREFEAA